MSRSLNRATLIGNTGSDPDVRTTPKGTRIAKVSLATNRTWKGGDGQRREETEWHRLTFFGPLAEILEQWVGKGDRLYVEGRIHYSQVEGDDGHTRHFTEVVVDGLIMLGGDEPSEGGSPPRGSDRRGRGGGRPARAPAPRGPRGNAAEHDDDLPF